MKSITKHETRDRKRDIRTKTFIYATKQCRDTNHKAVANSERRHLIGSEDGIGGAGQATTVLRWKKQHCSILSTLQMLAAEMEKRSRMDGCTTSTLLVRVLLWAAIGGPYRYGTFFKDVSYE